ncbi:pentapeptide repeat-containing protein, partial [Nostoc sp. NIES-2111]
MAVPLPNIEDPARLIRTVDDAPAPVLVGPMDPADRQRLQHVGTTDASWMAHDFPGLPVDTDPRLFLVAPPEQRRAGYFTGDEPFLLRGFSASRPEVSGRLPGLRVRAFVDRSSEPAGLFELPMTLDTIWLFGSVAKAVLIYRGAILLSDIDGMDARTVLLAYERAAEPPREPAYYAEQVRLRCDPDQAMKYMLADRFLRPARRPEDDAALLESRRAHTRELAERGREGRRLAYRLLAAKHGLPPDGMPEQPDDIDTGILLPTPEEIASGDIDIADLLESAEAFRDRQLAQLDEESQRFAGTMAAARRMPSDPDAFSALMASLPGVEGDEARHALDQARATDAAGTIDRILASIGHTADEEQDYRSAEDRFLNGPTAALFAEGRSVLAGADFDVPDRASTPALPSGGDVAALRADLEARRDGGSALPGIAASLERLDAAEAAIARAYPAIAGAAEGSPLDALLARIAPPEAAPVSAERVQTEGREALDRAERELADGLAQLRRTAPEALYPERPLSPHVARRLGDLVMAEHARTGSLAGRDFAGADLAGEDLSGTDLRGAFLEKANLSRCRLARAHLAEASLAGANLFGADLSHCDLRGANLSAARLTSATLTGAVFSGGLWMGTHLDGADASGSRWHDIKIVNGSMRGLKLTGAVLAQLMIVKTTLDGLVIDGGSMSECIVVETSAQGLSARKAELRRCAFMLLKAENADFSGAVLDDSAFVGPAIMPRGRWREASLAGATFQGADLTGGDFDSARCDRATLGEAKLDGASFRLASLKGAYLGSATARHLDAFAANFQGAQLRRADLTGAGLRQANIASADLSDTVLAGADLTGANLDQTHLRIATDAAG